MPDPARLWVPGETRTFVASGTGGPWDAGPAWVSPPWSDPLETAVSVPPERGERPYRHVLAALTEAPWAILPSAYAAIREIVARRVEGVAFTADEIAERIAAGPGKPEPYGVGGAVAVVPLYGPIFPRANLMTDVSGATSLDRFGASIDAAAADPQIASILLDVNSPGGSVDLLPETAAKIRAARSRKRVVAVANTMAASAAYWLASQATEVSITPSGMVGSVGVIAEHVDESRWLDEQGLTVSLITAGRFKAEATSTEPLGDEAREAIQGIVDHFYGLFVGDVATGRGVSRERVLADFGQGRMLTADAAVKAGMADRVETFDAALARVASGKGRTATAALAGDEAPEGFAVDEAEREGATAAGGDETEPASAAPDEGLDREADFAHALARLRI